mgnify:CR=1 FL=1
MNDLRKETLLVRLKTEFAQANPVATPIFQTAAFRSGDPYFYTRNSNPNFCEVEDIFTRLDGGSGSVLFASGMGAIDAVLGLLKHGDKIVVHSLIYGCSYRFFTEYCAHHGIALAYTDLSDPALRDAALDRNTKMVFFETPTNPFLRIVDIAEVVKAVKARSPEARVVVDNTWATPLFQNPLAWGADIAVYSCSKFFSGHSDIILGIATATDKTLVDALKKHRFYGGAVPDPFAAWLLRRSLQTLDVRMQRHVDNTRKVVEFLKAEPSVEEVYFPEIDGRQLRSYGGMIFLRLREDPDGTKADRFAGALRLFDRGTSMATVTSAVAIPYTGSHLSMTDEEKAKIGLKKSLVRLSIGIEASEDLIADIKSALLAALARP